MASAAEVGVSASSGQKLSGILDQALEDINNLDSVALGHSLKEIYKVRRDIADDEGLLSAQLVAQSHRIFPKLLEDPYTHHAFMKPRGFAGDASLIDLFYGHRSGYEAKTEAGRLVFETLMRSPSCDAVRYRRGYYGTFIDRTASGRSEPQVLALACGHLREALFSKAVLDGVVRLVGLDSDLSAVSEAQETLGPLGVEVRNASVVDFVRRRAWGETYDAIYAAGLFDYLDVKIGRKVVSAAFKALRPGGVLSVANFLPTIAEQGYMDLVMDWRLIYRTPQDMVGLAADLLTEQAAVETWTDPLDCVVYMTVTKRY